MATPAALVLVLIHSRIRQFASSLPRRPIVAAARGRPHLLVHPQPPAPRASRPAHRADSTPCSSLVVRIGPLWRLVLALVLQLVAFLLGLVDAGRRVLGGGVDGEEAQGVGADVDDCEG